MWNIFQHENLWRVVNQLVDGRRVYLSINQHLLVMPQSEAEYWHDFARLNTGIMVDELVYSPDLWHYCCRSMFLERLLPFCRVASIGIERHDRVPDGFVEGGLQAAKARTQFVPSFYRPRPIVLV
jgi:hypothetical protein